MSTTYGSSPHRVFVVGGGFGGLEAVRGLRSAPVDVTLVDRRSFHFFQRLAYQVGGSELAETLAKAAGAPAARGRRIAVGPDLSVGGHPEILAIGDMAQVHECRWGPRVGSCRSATPSAAARRPA
ncbi:FAD-dependent oxidoreductase [Candidatus Solirubrobacter pratensis]|uniref:FAD-dependent oxidoreductase n=1 Tax=Candidatus Solirubrobacter pratensis TaxID=1298857 RepID=UPI000417AFB2|nr:FAD-dependent oxidoreductase [Candidatus Solirubrobacter pratensis]